MIGYVVYMRFFLFLQEGLYCYYFLQRQYETSLYWKQSSGERRKKNLSAASLPYPVSPRSKSAPQVFNPLTLLGVWPSPSKAPIGPTWPVSRCDGLSLSVSTVHRGSLVCADSSSCQDFMVIRIFVRTYNEKSSEKKKYIYINWITLLYSWN